MANITKVVRNSTLLTSPLDAFLFGDTLYVRENATDEDINGFKTYFSNPNNGITHDKNGQLLWDGIPYDERRKQRLGI